MTPESPGLDDSDFYLAAQGDVDESRAAPSRGET